MPIGHICLAPLAQLRTFRLRENRGGGYAVVDLGPLVTSPARQVVAVCCVLEYSEIEPSRLPDLPVSLARICGSYLES